MASGDMNFNKRIKLFVRRYCALAVLIVTVIGSPTKATKLSEKIFINEKDDFRFVSYHDLLITSKRFSDHNVTTFSRMLFDDKTHSIVLGARNHLYKLSLQLDLIQRVVWEVPESVFETCLLKGQSENDCQNYIMAIHDYQDKLLICSTYAFSPKCTWRTSNDLNLIKEETSTSLTFNPHSNITTLVTNDGKMFVGSTVDFSGSDSAILRTDLTNKNSKIIRTRQYNDIELFEPNFVGSFEHGNFVYFVFRELSIETASLGGGKAVFSRIARVCKNDAGGIHFSKENWTSFLKARLNCSIPGGDFPFYFDEVQDISYLPDEEELYAVFSTPENSIHGSAICVYNMSTIQKAFSGPVKYQETGSPIWQTINIPEDNFLACKNTQRSNLFDSAKYKLMEGAVQAVHLNPLYVEKLEIFTHISVTKLSTKIHESVAVLFVANKEGYIKKISILPRTKQSCLIEILELEKHNKIISIMFSKASESLYIGTSNAFFQIPSQRCSRHLTKDACINSMDPFCGYNELGQKCGTAPNNDPLTSYFYQNATSCPILSESNKIVDGSFSPWSMWFKCAKSGDHPTREDELSNNFDTCLCRERSCTNPTPKNGGAFCTGHTIMVTNCTSNGAWTEWSAWSTCSQTCGIAIKVRRRTCSNPKPAFGGRTCVGVDRQEIYCTDLPPCPVPTPFEPFKIPVDGNWGPFGDWGECSSPCGTGYRMRQRKCDDPAPLNGGLECTGCNVEYEQCNKQPCIEVKKLGPFTPWLMVNTSDIGFIEKRFRFQCKATALSDPTELKISLYKEETRTCNTDGGCHRMHEVLQKSPSWGCWTDYSACSVSCGVGRRVRYRKCIGSNGDILGDNDCDGSSVLEEICEMPSCNANTGKDEGSTQCKSSQEQFLLASTISLHWMIILIFIVSIVTAILTIFATKYFYEQKFKRLRRINGSPHYIPSHPNQYSSLPMKDFTENNKPKRQPSFSNSKLINCSTLNRSNNNLLNQNTPKILKFQNDTDSSTLKRNSALNNMRLKPIDDDMDKY